MEPEEKVDPESAPFLLWRAEDVDAIHAVPDDDRRALALRGQVAGTFDVYIIGERVPLGYLVGQLDHALTLLPDALSTLRRLRAMGDDTSAEEGEAIRAEVDEAIARLQDAIGEHPAEPAF